MAEAAFLRIFCRVRAFLIESGLPDSFWFDTFLMAIYVLNRSPQGRGAAAVTPYERVHKTKPNVRNLRVFGCLAYSLINKTQRDSKIHAVAETGFHIGMLESLRGSV